MLLVKAAVGLCVPMEHDPRRHIADVAVNVDDCAYYQRRLAEGDLVLVESKQKGKENV